MSTGITIRKDGYTKWVLGNFFNGAVSGYATLLVLYAFDVPQIVWANRQIEWQRYLDSKLTDLAWYKPQFLKAKLSSMYKGFLLVSISASIYRGCYYGLFDTLKVSVPNYFIIHAGIASMASMLGFLAVCPITTVIRQSIL